MKTQIAIVKYIILIKIDGVSQKNILMGAYQIYLYLI